MKRDWAGTYKTTICSRKDICLFSTRNKAFIIETISLPSLTMDN